MQEGASQFDRLRTLHVALWDVALSTAFGTIVSGTFLIGFVKSVGGSDMWIGVVTALPSLLGLLQIPGAVWGRANPSYKRFITPGGWAWRLLYLPLIALPLMAWSGEAKLQVLALCIALATAAVQIVSPIYNEWIADLVPPSSRGWYFARRTAVSTAVAMAVAFGGGVMLDEFRAAGREATGFSILFGLGFVCSMASMAFFLAMRDSVRAAPVRVGMRESLRQFKAPLQSPNFRRVLVYVVVFAFGSMLAGGLFIAFARETLDLSYTSIQLTQVAHALGTLLTSAAWGYLTDRYGNKPILVILTAGTVLTPVVWLVCQPGRPEFNTAVLVAGHVYNGAVWSGVGVAQMNLWLATGDEEDRANYLGMAVALQAAAAGVAPLAGAALMSGLRGGLGAEMAYKWVFVAVMAVRLVSLFTLMPVHEPGAVGLRRTLRGLRKVSPRGILALRAISRASEPGERARAVAQVAQANLTLGVDELVAALADPVPRVRREAAAALERLADPGSSARLVEFVTENPELVEEETLAALGAVASPEAIAALSAFLQDPRAILRRAAAKALGRIGDPSATTPLVEAARSDDRGLRRAALQALRTIGDPAAAKTVVENLEHESPSVVVAAAEAAAEIDAPGLAAPLRAALAKAPPEALGELAYALACRGSDADLGLIVHAARSATTLTSRRRCLLGLARRLGVEGPAYRLFAAEGFARDRLLLRMVGPALRAEPRLRAAARSLAAGDELQALRSLSRMPGVEWVFDTAQPAVPELAMVALVAAARQASGSLARAAGKP